MSTTPTGQTPNQWTAREDPKVEGFYCNPAVPVKSYLKKKKTVQKSKMQGRYSFTYLHVQRIDSVGFSHFSRVRRLATPWTAARQPPLGPWDSPGKHTGAGCRALLQGIFPTPGTEPSSTTSLALQADCLPVTHPGSPHTCRKAEQISSSVDIIFKK